MRVLKLIITLIGQRIHRKKFVCHYIFQPEIYKLPPKLPADIKGKYHIVNSIYRAKQIFDVFGAVVYSIAAFSYIIKKYPYAGKIVWLATLTICIYQRLLF